MTGRGKFVWFLVVAIGCSNERGVLTDTERLAIQHSVDSATRAFAQAQRDLDADRVIAHLAPEFYMYLDGVRVDYDAIVPTMRASFGALRQLDTRFRDVEVIVLGPNAAVTTFTFHDEVTDSTGTVAIGTGPTTLAWVRNDHDWLIVYADADHYPANP